MRVFGNVTVGTSEGKQEALKNTTFTNAAPNAVPFFGTAE